MCVLHVCLVHLKTPVLCSEFSQSPMPVPLHSTYILTHMTYLHVHHPLSTHTHTHTTHAGQYPGVYQQQPTPTSSVPTSYHTPHSPAAVATVAATVGASAAISAEEERRHFEESRRIERQSLESAVEDKIRRQVKQVLDAAQV